MKKFLFFVALVVTLWALPLVSFTQSTVPIRGDTVRVYKQNDSSYLKVDSFLFVTKQAVIGYPYLPLSTSALLELNSTSRGFIPSRMSAAQRLAIGSPGAANFVWDGDSLRYMGYDGSVWKGVAWTSEVGGGIPSLAQVTNVGNTTPNAIHVIPSYLSNYSTALTFAGNGVSAYGALIMRENSTGTGNIVTLKPVPALSADIILNVPDAPDGDTLLTRAHARALGYQPPTAGANWGGVLSFTQVISIDQNISSTSNVTTGASPLTLTMPTISGNSNRVVFIKNGGSDDVTVQRAGSDQLWTTAAVNSIVLEPGESVSIQQVGSYWYVFFEPSSGGGVSAANLPLRITGGTTVSADTSYANNPSLTTNQRLQFVIDSLKALGWGAQVPAYDSWYSSRNEFGGWGGGGSGADDGDFMTVSSGAGSSAQGQSSGLFAGWMGGAKFITGTTSTGYGISVFATGFATNAQVVMDSLIRSNAGAKVRIDALSSGTERFLIGAGLTDNPAAPHLVMDGVYFRYVDSDSSGNWIMVVANNSVRIEKDSGVPVAINTDYELEVSVFKGVGYYYINDAFVGTITPSMGMPYGETRGTSVGVGILKSIGTTSRNMWVDWIAFGSRKN